MTDSQSPATRTSAWYFIAATFVLAGSVFARTLLDNHLLANIAIGVGVVLFIAGIVVARRERRSRHEGSQ